MPKIKVKGKTVKLPYGKKKMKKVKKAAEKTMFKNYK